MRMPIALALLTLPFLPGCAPTHGSSALPAVLDATTQTGIPLEVRTDPAPIPLNEPFELDVRIGAAFAARADANLEVEGWMPGHGHGMARTPRVEALGDGRFRVRGMLFHMEGLWELRLSVAWREEAGEHFQVRRDGAVVEVRL